jgi:uncharacterized membrane protein required for colicin V production
MDQLGITVFDVAVIAVALFGAAMGLSAGFSHAVLFIASWIGAGWVAVHFSKIVQPEIEQLVGNPELAYFVALLVVFVAALIVLVMLTNAFSRSIRASPLARPDRILGAGFGILCTWAILGMCLLFYRYLGPRQLPPAVEGAMSYKPLLEMANFIEPQLPQGFRTRLQQRPGALPDAGTMAVPSPADSTQAPAPDATGAPPPAGAKPPQ